MDMSSDNMIYSMQMTMNYGFDTNYFLFEKFKLDGFWSMMLAMFVVFFMAFITELLK